MSYLGVAVIAFSNLWTDLPSTALEDCKDPEYDDKMELVACISILVGDLVIESFQSIHDLIQNFTSAHFVD